MLQYVKMRSTLLAAALVAVAGLTITVWRGHKVAISLREENRQLQTRVTQLEQSARDVAPTTPEPDPAITSELMKLRAEVADLRRHTNEVQKLQRENAELKSTLVAAQSAAAAAEVKPLSTGEARSALFFPRDTWAFAGFASPEDTLKSAAWAMSKGDLNTFLASLSPSHREQMERRWQGKSQEEITAESRREMEKTTGYHILDKQIVSEDEILLRVFAEGDEGDIRRMRMKRFGAEWKFDGVSKVHHRDRPSGR